jgi:hypothetical protein
MTAERPCHERTPRLDRLVSRQVGRVLVWLARRAHARGDRHEFNHIRAAVTAGNSAPCERDGRCQLERNNTEGIVR